MGHEGDIDAKWNWCTWNNLTKKRTSENHPYYSIIKIDQNNEKSPGDLRRLAVTQTSKENHQLILV